MTLAQFSVLNHFVRLGGPKSPLALARAFQLTKATISSTLTRLEAKGLVSIVPDLKDGRAKLVDITVQGRAMRDVCIACVVPDIKHISGLPSLPNLEALLPLLADLREALDKDRNRSE
jgi:DNA-binding MarR family transcriptional regulator